jgi:DNA-binding MarR family transcriptional regulator
VGSDERVSGVAPHAREQGLGETRGHDAGAASGAAADGGAADGTAADDAGHSVEAADAELAPALAAYTGHLLRRAYIRANRLAPVFEPVGGGAASARDFEVLHALAEPGASAYSQQELGELLGINRTTMVKLLDRLEAAGQVVRSRNPGDRRSYVLGLTGGGRDALKAMEPEMTRRDDRLTADLGAAERDRLDALLAALLAGRRADSADPADSIGSIDPVGPIEPADPAVSGRPAEQPADRPAGPAPAGEPRRTGALIARAHHVVRRRIEAALDDAGLQARHFGALTVLAAGPCSQQQLARRLGVNEQTVLQIVDDLEAAGRVVRERDPRDRRRYALRLTPAGQDALRLSRRVVAAIETELGRTLGTRGRAELKELLTKLLRAEL